MQTLSAVQVLTGTADLGPGWVQLDAGRIIDVGAGLPPVPADVHLTEGALAPGLVDAQLNGAFGVDVAAADDRQWQHLTRRLPSTGVTAFAPTVISAPVDDLCESLRRFGRLHPTLDADPTAARALGVHVEGPFLAPNARGAHRLDLLRDPEPALVEALVEAGSGGALLYVTLAPERPGALAAITTFVDAGVRVALGHSQAPHEVVHAAADAGASLVTHLFNAQGPLHHREPGVVGATLVDDRLTAGLIGDGHHVHPTAMRVAFSCKPNRIMLVTDGVAALGMPDGTYELGGDVVTVSGDDPARRRDGTIAGGACRLDDAIGVAVGAGVDLQVAVQAATAVPASALGRDNLGRIAPGAVADLVWLAPEGSHALRARATWLAGRLVHGRVD